MGNAKSNCILAEFYFGSVGFVSSCTLVGLVLCRVGPFVQQLLCRVRRWFVGFCVEFRPH